MIWGKGKGTYTWYSASSWINTSEALRYGTCSQEISQFYLHTHTFIRNRNEPYLPLPSQEGCKAELAWVAGYVVIQFTCPRAVTRPTILTWLDVEQLRWSRPTHYHYTKPPHEPELDGEALVDNDTVIYYTLANNKVECVLCRDANQRRRTTLSVGVMITGRACLNLTR